jgi:multicomponent Na+:H+ antiporter subunit F
MSEPIVGVLIVGALVAIALAVVRLVRGPTQADRIVALDVVFSANIALSAAATLGTGRALFLDIGVGLGIVGFVATIVWARLIAGSPRGAK